MKRPNIIFILTDDQRFDTIGALNCPDIDTPNFDRLVRSGLAFTQATIMGGTSPAVCMPSRNMILTGRGLYEINAHSRIIPEDHVTFPEVLRNAGYRTWHVGKWHQDLASHKRCFMDGAKLFMSGIEANPQECDFHWHLHLFDYRADSNYVKGEYQCQDPPIRPFTPPYTRHKEDGLHSSTVFTNAAIDMIRSHDQGDDPFMLYLAYVAPHDPRQYPSRYFRKYNADDIPLPENFLPRHPFDNGDLMVRDELLAGHPRLPWEIREHIKDYYAIVSHLDEEIGRLLDTLDETGRADDTIVILAGDNGLAVGQHGLMGKQNLYEHSIRVPLIMRGPDIPRNARSETPCYLADLCPTLCEMAGASAPGSATAKSLLPAVTNQNRRIHDRTYHGYLDIQRALRQRPYKLIEYHVNGQRRTQLFDIVADPKEMHDLAGDASCAEVLRRMQTEILLCRDACGDYQPEYGQPFWQDYPASAEGH